jgi:hypothetical protein
MTEGAASAAPFPWVNDAFVKIPVPRIMARCRASDRSLRGSALLRPITTREGKQSDLFRVAENTIPSRE